MCLAATLAGVALDLALPLPSRAAAQALWLASTLPAATWAATA